jgi:hypothetical protein
MRGRSGEEWAAAGGWRLAAGGWRLAAGGWRLAAGGELTKSMVALFQYVLTY